MDAYEQFPLPIQVTKEDLANNPKFGQLLSVLCEKILPSGVTAKSHQQLESVKESRERYNWFTNHIPYFTLQDLWSDLIVRGQTNTLSSDETKLKNVLSETLAFNEIEDCLPLQPLPKPTTTLFGLTREDVRRHNPVKQHAKALQKVLVPMLEERMAKKCHEIFDFLEPTQEDSSEPVDPDLKSRSLIRMVEEMQVQLGKELDALKRVQEKKQEYLRLYYQKLLECLAITGAHLQEIKMNSQTKSDKVYTDYLTCNCDAVHLKLRVIQMQLLCSTYTSSSVKALKQIGAHLDSALKKTEEELVATTTSLQAYRELGPEFKTLAEEWTWLTTEIDNRKWALQKLGTQDSKDGGGDGVGGGGGGLEDMYGGLKSRDVTAAGLMRESDEEGAVGGQL